MWQHLPCRTGRLAERFPRPHPQLARAPEPVFYTHCLSAPPRPAPPPPTCAGSEGPGREQTGGARGKPRLSQPPPKVPTRPSPPSCRSDSRLIVSREAPGALRGTCSVRVLPGEKPTREGSAVPLGRDDRWQLREPPPQRRDGGGDGGEASPPGLEPVKPRAPGASRLPLGRRSWDSGARAPGSSGGSACSLAGAGGQPGPRAEGNLPEWPSRPRGGRSRSGGCRSPAPSPPAVGGRSGGGAAGAAFLGAIPERSTRRSRAASPAAR